MFTWKVSSDVQDERRYKIFIFFQLEGINVGIFFSLITRRTFVLKPEQRLISRDKLLRVKGIMVNSSQIPYFILTAYLDMGYLKYLYFVIVLMLYIVIVVANAFLIVTICMKRSLHEPMYVFLCSLLVNQLYGSAGLFPFLLLRMPL
jgi:hypothetical protein